MPKRKAVEKKEENKWGGIFALLVVVLLIGGVLFALFSGPPPTEVEDEGTLLNQSAYAVSQITKETFTFEGAMETTSDQGYFAMRITGDGKIDSENERMYMKLNVESPVIEKGAVSKDVVVIESYTIDETIYTQMFDSWGKYAQDTQRLWDNAHLGPKLVDFAIRFGSQLDSTEIVNGKETYKVVATPSMGELIDWVFEIDPGVLDTTGIINIDRVRGVKSIELTTWIDVEDFLPVKAELVMDVTTPMLNPDPDATGVIPLDATISAEVNFNYNTSFSIVLPPAADGAENLLALG